ncbi:sigma-70 family RNA polymerase sigma factor [uncultured Duncaniella sp.]|jgi:RNA polymerase sigma-70 factor (ECF subfamily)|uniref:sigma-70 family RNA polymerase sigma factor n=2 Tax=uncultured Duncaniella sp. TaxID=2768039 RepID=UPI0025B0A86B|nr:sigma-70 family RNA polymerase sigma factor [uncultured Duncaniella sp.]
MNMTNLIRRCENGDKDAMAELYRIYSPCMLRLVKRYVTDLSAAEDVLHDGFIIVFANIGKLKNTDKLEFWIRTIMKNLSLQYLKHLEATQLIDEEEEITDTPYTENKLSYEELDEIIGKLPTGYQKIFRLAVFENKSHKEIGEILGIAPNSSSSQLARAKAMLRRLINDREAKLYMLVSVSMLTFSALYLKNRPEPPVLSNSDIPDQQSKSTTDFDLNYGNIIVAEVTRNGVDATTAEPAVSKKSSSQQATIGGNSSCTPSGHDTATEDISPNKHDRHQEEMAENMQPHAPTDTVIRDMIDSPTDLSDIPSYIADEKNKSGWQKYSIGATMRYTCIKATTESDILQPGLPSNVKFVERKVHHYFPMIFGITFSRSLSPRLALETGVTYTCLRSKLEYESDNDYAEMKTTAHFVGIPLKLNYSLFSYDGLSAYTTIGCKIDLPVNTHCETIHNTTDTPLPMLKPSLQFSIEGGIGIEYRLTRGINIYTEPSVTYHPDNHSSLPTTWQERPLMFNIPIGIRFCLQNEI